MSDNSNDISVLVIGAGELGTAILDALAAHPQRHSRSISVLLRPSTISRLKNGQGRKREYYESRGISLLPGEDVEAADVDTLAALFAPFHTIVGCTGMGCGPGTQLKLARAVLLAGTVQRYIPWQFGVDYDVIGWDSAQDLFTEQVEARDVLRRQNAMQWVIISTGLFMSFLLESSAFGVVVCSSSSSNDDDDDGKTVTVRALGEWKNEVSVTAVEDIGRVVAEIVWVTLETRGVVFVAGDTLSYKELADRVEKVVGLGGQTVVRQRWSLDKLRSELDENPEDPMKKYRIVFAEGRGIAWDRGRTWNVERRLELLSAERWLEEKMGRRGKMTVCS